MITMLSGGTGTPKLLLGFGDREDLCTVVNVAEDMEQSGGYVSPDMDSVVYALAGMIDESKWYGVKDDTFVTYNRMAFLGYTELLRTGDLDRATKLARKKMLDSGMGLTEIVERMCEACGIKTKVFPASDRKITTRIETVSGEKSFHEFWVRDGGKERVLSVSFEGLKEADAPQKALRLCEESKAIIIGPSNPITSVSPIVCIKDWRRMLEKKRVVAVSPFLGNDAFSGPASSLMRGYGLEASPYGVACLYRDFLDTLVIHTSDSAFKGAIEDLGVEVVQTNIILNTGEERRALASFLEGTL